TYSWHCAISGSTRVARRAGSQHATNATPASSTATPMPGGLLLEDHHRRISLTGLSHNRHQLIGRDDPSNQRKLTPTTTGSYVDDPAPIRGTRCLIRRREPLVRRQRRRAAAKVRRPANRRAPRTHRHNTHAHAG